MAKLVLNNITSGFTSTTALNTAFDAIEAAMENTVSRDGTSPNSMSADLDMNGNDIINVADMLVGGVGLAASVTAASGSAAAAATSASNAATSASNAATSETNAAASAVDSAVSAAIVADWDYRGAWVTATSYLKNNIVYESTNGASYIALSDHTSGTFDTDLGAAKWGLLALRGSAGAGTGDMLKSENLSGLANNTTARSNLGAQTVDPTLTALAALDATAGLVEQTGADAFTKRAIGGVVDASVPTNASIKPLLNQIWGSDGVTRITQSVANGTDLNTLTSAGVYNFSAAGSLNSPAETWIFLEVFRNSDLTNLYTIQIAHDMNSGSVPRSWTRRQVPGAWTAWVQTTPIASIGVDQTWQDLTASRLSGTTYTNSTSRPIFVVLKSQQASSGSTSLTVAGLVVGTQQQNSIVGGGTISAIVPVGITYSYTTTNTVSVYELR